MLEYTKISSVISYLKFYYSKNTFQWQYSCFWEQSNDFPIRFCTNDKIYNHETSIAHRQLYFQSIGQAMKGIQRVSVVYIWSNICIYTNKIYNWMLRKIYKDWFMSWKYINLKKFQGYSLICPKNCDFQIRESPP